MVGASGVLELDPGTSNFCDLLVARNGALRIVGGTTINVRGTVRIANGGTLAPFTPGPAILINTTGALVRIGADAVVKAFITAPDAEMRLGRGAVLEGSFCVNTLRNDKNIMIECPCDG
jgi:hypothetical protein